MTHRIDGLRAPLLVSWQLTRDCDLCCLHCCTESAPGKRLPDELDARRGDARSPTTSSRNDVPYVMLCGGEPLVVPHFFDGRRSARATRACSSRSRPTASASTRQSPSGSPRLPIRSIQISLDGDTRGRLRAPAPGRLARQGARGLPRASGQPACRSKITFAPTRLNIHEAEAVIERARALGAFRFNTGKLMRIGTAARLWDRLEPDADAIPARSATCSSARRQR